MSGKRKKQYKRKRKKNSGNRDRKLEAKKARRKKRPSQSAIVLKQKQDAAMEARRMVRDLTSPLSPLLMGVPVNTEPIKRIKA